MVNALFELLTQIVKGSIGVVMILLVGTIPLFVYNDNYEMQHYLINLERVIAQNQYGATIEIQIHEKIAELYAQRDQLRIVTEEGEEITHDLLKADMYQEIYYEENSNTLVIIT